MDETTFDAIVIGAGQGGAPLSRELAGRGWRTALVERRFVGGVCTNDGCTPTKTMVAVARSVEEARRAGQFGLTGEPTTADLAKVRAYVDAKVCTSRRSLERALGAAEHLKLIYGEASFAPPQNDGQGHAVSVQLRGGGERMLRSARVFLDTGERPAVPEIDGLRSVPFLDSTSVLELGELPSHLLILGGGYIAVEFAQIFRRFGSAVTILERGEQLVAREDEDVAACLAEILRQDGIEIVLGATVERVSAAAAGRVAVTWLEGGAGRVAMGSHLLVATGRTPNTESLHLEKVGVAVDSHGYVRVDERLRTTVEGIWAMGDVTGGPPYTHIAYDDFRVLRSQLLEDGARVTTGRMVPYCIFTDPELARVGLSERDARRAGLDVRIARAPMRKVARAWEMGDDRGMMKAVVDRATGRVLGATILGVNGGEVVTELQLAMMGGLDYRTLREAIFIHPVLAEGLHVLFRNLSE